ncbi:glycosyltransferase [Candidatus Parvarchaeota archaeon]|nr:glycosyltransferase [Candidatus Parvarchaeota archaeon]
MEVTLIAETLDPSRGGIPRYNYEISKIKDIKNVVDFSKSLSNEGLSNKLLNKLYRRKKVLERNADKLGKVLHFTQPEVMVKTKELRKRKVILTVHDLAVFGAMKVKGIYGSLRGMSFRKQFKFAVERADTIMVNSTQTRDELINILKADAGKIVVDNLGIEEKFKPLEVKKEGIIGYFGGFNRRKRVDKLIDDFIASSLNAKLKLVIFGNNEDYPILKKKYEKFGSIIFKDKIPEEDIVKVINGFDYFVYPTSYEGFGLPLLECIACGIPSFVYKDAVIPEEVKKYAIEIDKLDDIITKDYKELQKEFTEKAKKAKEEFSWDKCRGTLLEEYKKLLN